MTSLVVVASSVVVAEPARVTAAGPQHRFLADDSASGSSKSVAASVAAAGIGPTGFTDNQVWTGLTTPIAIRFASDGRIFVAEKSGIIKVYSDLNDQTPTIFADLRPNVDDYWDRGLLGMTLDPAFPAQPYVYVLYAFDAPIGGTPPVWNDNCGSPPGPTTDGCVISGRLSRLTASGDTMTGPEQVLINDWCQQYPSHSLGDLRFGADGALYVSGGDGASWTDADYGQFGGGAGSPTPKNPCGDPPGAVGTANTIPTGRGGALRSQSLRRPATEPVRLNGTILRVDPATGLAKANNPLIGRSDLNARRIVGYGFRNPFRFTVRPGTNELWIGDVGWDNYEEIDRITDPLASTVANAGWPCYEGPGRAAGYETLGLDMCSSLYSAPTGLLTPYLSYSHGGPVVAGETCAVGSSAIAGVSFYTGASYPSKYANALFFTDHARNCIWAMKTGSNGLPDPTKVETFLTAAVNPVDLESGPNGDLFYVDFDTGTIHRITYAASGSAPTASISATPPNGSAPLAVAFSGAGSADPDGGALTYAWDLDGDGQLDDSNVVAPSWTYPSDGNYVVTLRVTDPTGLTGTATTTIVVDSTLPVPVIDTPAASLTWAVGDPIAFSGHATRSNGSALPASALTWTLILHHCPSNCHTHTVQSWVGVAGATVAAPDHDYPSYLELVLTAADGAKQASVSRQLDPKTVNLSFVTNPTGLQLSAGTTTATAPFTKTVIQKSSIAISAPSSQVLGTTNYAFQSWSDGGAASHQITSSSTPVTYTATYTASGGTTSYLSDLAYTVTANGWGPPEKDRSNGEDGAADGLPLTLEGVVYAKGIGAHAASDIRYTMTSCTAFSAKVGVDDEVLTRGSIVFQVYADGTKVFDSGTMTGSSPTQTVALDMTGRAALRLVITNAADNNTSDHGDWADAKLTCG